MRKAFQTQNNFIKSNKKNLLKSAAEKLHPTFSVWPRSRDRTPLKLESKLNQPNSISKGHQEVEKQQSSDDGESVGRKKKALIDAM